MAYRTLPKSGGRISTVALGGTHMADLTPQESAGLVSQAVANGINFVDFATTSPKSFALFGPEIKRHRLMFSLHLGLQYSDMLGKCVYCGHCQPCPSNIDKVGVIDRMRQTADIFAEPV